MSLRSARWRFIYHTETKSTAAFLVCVDYWWYGYRWKQIILRSSCINSVVWIIKLLKILSGQTVNCYSYTHGEFLFVHNKEQHNRSRENKTFQIPTWFSSFWNSFGIDISGKTLWINMPAIQRWWLRMPAVHCKAGNRTDMENFQHKGLEFEML